MSDLPISVANIPINWNNSGKNGDMTQTLISQPFDIREWAGYAAQFTWNGTNPIGEVFVSVCNDGINFIPNPNSTLPVSGNTGGDMINSEWPRYYFVQLNYIPTSGAGNLIAYISAKRN